MTMSVVLQTPTGVTQLVGVSGTVYTADAFGRITITDSRDLGPALASGCVYSPTDTRWYTAGSAPAAAAAANVVAAVAVANGTLTIAGQPDVPRNLQIVQTGTPTITAGSVNITMVNSQGVTLTESVALASANGTLTTNNAVGHVVGASVSGAAGSALGTISIGSGAALGLPLPAGFANLTVFKQNTDGADVTNGTIDGTYGKVTPNTAPNGTHTYSFGYTFVLPAN